MKYLIYALMLMVIYSLGSASFYMLKARDSKKMAKALTWRIGLSLLIFALLLVAAIVGWWEPHAILSSG
jgi:hypothetical protein